MSTPERPEEIIRFALRGFRDKQAHTFDSGPCQGPSLCKACLGESALAAVGELVAERDRLRSVSFADEAIAALRAERDELLARVGELVARAEHAEAAVSRLTEALREAEWGGDEGTCPTCCRVSWRGHAADCSLAAALGGAAGGTQDREGPNPDDVSPSEGSGVPGVRGPVAPLGATDREAPPTPGNRRIANRILLTALADVWDNVPDHRFGQFVMNLSREPGGFADTWEWGHAAWRERLEEARRTWAVLPEEHK